jgi:diguanylate cyclase (GGDEF)-like protein/PAS domain S-box-containing protein
MACTSTANLSDNVQTSSLLPRQIEGREWWMWGLAVSVTLALTAGIVFLTFFGEHTSNSGSYWTDLRDWVRGLAALVLLFDIYTMYQHLQLQRMRRRLAAREQLFQLITENAADLIAVVDNNGTRLYNSPAYQRVLGYSANELSSSSSLEQIHIEDRDRVARAATKARDSGRVQRLEYRMRHKDGSWRVLESTASPIRDSGNSIQGLVIVNRDITERKRAEEMLAHSAFYDGVTNLPNRTLFADRLQHAVLRSHRHSDYEFAVLFIDIDEFKVFNDSLGRSAGDDLLIQVAGRLAASFRDTDTVSRSAELELNSIQGGLARLGGDEFTVLLEDVLNPSDAIRVAERIQQKLAIPFAADGQQIVISASIGVVSSRNSYSSAEEVLRDGEIAMHRAKQAGRARCELFDPAMHSRAVQRLRLETDLRRGLENGELLVYYQPIICLASGKIAGFEALSRWQTPRGLVSPAEFIPIADETGLIIPMNQALLRVACQQLRDWQDRFGYDPPLTMSINLAPKQLGIPELATEISTVLRDISVAPENISFEIMETVAMEDAERALMVLSELKALGVRLSIDDFGTGYSSLSRLPRFPIDALKIDRSFISDMQSDGESREIVRLIIMLAHSMGLKVVAEGTETLIQIEELKLLDCEMAQGYFYSPPVSAQSASDLLMSAAGALDNRRC